MKLAAIVIFMVGGIALLIRTTMGRGSFSYPLLYPQVMLIAVLVLFAVLLVDVVRQRRAIPADGLPAPKDAPRGLHRETMAPALGLLACVLYIALWNILGHLLSTILFLLAMLAIGRERSVWIFLGIGLILPVVIWFVFDDFLRIPLPGPAF